MIRCLLPRLPYRVYFVFMYPADGGFQCFFFSTILQSCWKGLSTDDWRGLTHSLEKHSIQQPRPLRFDQLSYGSDRRLPAPDQILTRISLGREQWLLQFSYVVSRGTTAGNPYDLSLDPTATAIFPPLRRRVSSIWVGCTCTSHFRRFPAINSPSRNHALPSPKNSCLPSLKELRARLHRIKTCFQTTDGERKLPSATAIPRLELLAARTARQPRTLFPLLVPSDTVRANLGDTSCVYLLFPQEVACCECDSSRRFRLALNLTPCCKRAPRVFGSSLQSTSFLSGDRALSSPENLCLPFPKELRV